MQISRGCPFQCEFCDIIVTFGRRPRLKTSAQVIAELEALSRGKDGDRVHRRRQPDRQQAGDQAAAGATWPPGSEQNGYPLTFFTEASLDLAEDAELMQLMTEANIVSVFIGIESPNEESLRETKKFQNVREGGTIVERVRVDPGRGPGRLVRHDPGLRSRRHDDFCCPKASFCTRPAVQHAMIGMLPAIPKTPLLRPAGRREAGWTTSDEPSYGTNVIPLQMSRDELTDGYIELMRDVYSPQAYFDRVDALFLNDRFRFAVPRMKYSRNHPCAA